MAWVKEKLNLNTIFLAAILIVLAYFVVSALRPPVSYTKSEYTASPSVICAGDSISWVSGIEMRAPRQPADMTTARDLWDATNGRRVPGVYRAQSFIIPHTVGYTSTEVFSNTAHLLPADYILSDTTGGRLTARDGYTVRFSVRACDER